MSRKPMVLLVLALLVLGGAIFFLREAHETTSDAPPRSPDRVEDEPTPPAEPRTGQADPTTPSTPPTARPERRTPASTLARFGWGSGPNELGRNRPEEANPEAPMSFAPGPNGSVVVLDQVNGRLVRLGPDGEVTGTTRLEQTAPQDVAVAADGTVVVMDRLADRDVAVLSPSGELLGRLPLEGDLLEEAGGVTAVIVDGEDVYAEREHGPLVHLGDIHGRAASARHEIPGRPSRDGRLYLLASLVDAMAGRLIVNATDRDSGEHRFTRQLRALMMIREILLLDSDGAGVVYLAVVGAPSADHPEYQEVHLICLSAADGSTIGTSILPANMDADETMRQMTVLPEGGVLYGVRTEDEMVFQRFDCRGT